MQSYYAEISFEHFLKSVYKADLRFSFRCFLEQNKFEIFYTDLSQSAGRRRQRKDTKKKMMHSLSLSDDGLQGVPSDNQVEHLHFPCVLAPTGDAMAESFTFLDASFSGNLESGSDEEEPWLDLLEGSMPLALIKHDHQSWLANTYGNQTTWAQTCASTVGKIVSIIPLVA